jgi:hypothetical protein
MLGFRSRREVKRSNATFRSPLNPSSADRSSHFTQEEPTDSKLDAETRLGGVLGN